MDEHLLGDADDFLGGSTPFNAGSWQDANTYAEQCARAYETALRMYLHERLEELEESDCVNEVAS